MLIPEFKIPLGIGIYCLTFLVVGIVLLISLGLLIYFYLSSQSESLITKTAVVFVSSLTVFILGNFAFFMFVPENVDLVSGKGQEFDWWMIWIWTPSHLIAGFLTIMMLRYAIRATVTN